MLDFTPFAPSLGDSSPLSDVGDRFAAEDVLPPIAKTSLESPNTPAEHGTGKKRKGSSLRSVAEHTGSPAKAVKKLPRTRSKTLVKDDKENIAPVAPMKAEDGEE